MVSYDVVVHENPENNASEKINFASSWHLFMHYMINIDDDVCIINHRILRYIRVGENNKRYRERRILSFIRFESVEDGSRRLTHRRVPHRILAHHFLMAEICPPGFCLLEVDPPGSSPPESCPPLHFHAEFCPLPTGYSHPVPMIYIFERLKTFKFCSVRQTGIQLERKQIHVMYVV